MYIDGTKQILIHLAVFMTTKHFAEQVLLDFHKFDFDAVSFFFPSILLCIVFLILHSVLREEEESTQSHIKQSGNLFQIVTETQHFTFC